MAAHIAVAITSAEKLPQRVPLGTVIAEYKRQQRHSSEIVERLVTRAHVKVLLFPLLTNT